MAGGAGESGGSDTEPGLDTLWPHRTRDSWEGGPGPAGREAREPGL